MLKFSTVVVDNKLRSSSRHIAAAAACANRKLGLLKHTFKYWGESLATLFKVFVRPHLEYCIQSYAPTLRGDIETLPSPRRRYRGGQPN